MLPLYRSATLLFNYLRELKSAKGSPVFNRTKKRRNTLVSALLTLSLFPAFAINFAETSRADTPTAPMNFSVQITSSETLPTSGGSLQTSDFYILIPVVNGVDAYRLSISATNAQDAVTTTQLRVLDSSNLIDLGPQDWNGVTLPTKKYILNDLPAGIAYSFLLASIDPLDPPGEDSIQVEPRNFEGVALNPYITRLRPTFTGIDLASANLGENLTISGEHLDWINGDIYGISFSICISDCLDDPTFRIVTVPTSDFITQLPNQITFQIPQNLLSTVPSGSSWTIFPRAWGAQGEVPIEINVPIVPQIETPNALGISLSNSYNPTQLNFEFHSGATANRVIKIVDLTHEENPPLELSNVYIGDLRDYNWRAFLYGLLPSTEYSVSVKVASTNLADNLDSDYSEALIITTPSPPTITTVSSSRSIDGDLLSLSGPNLKPYVQQASDVRFTCLDCTALQLDGQANFFQLSASNFEPETDDEVAYTFDPGFFTDDYEIYLEHEFGISIFFDDTEIQTDKTILFSSTPGASDIRVTFTYEGPFGFNGRQVLKGEWGNTVRYSGVSPLILEDPQYMLYTFDGWYSDEARTIFYGNAGDEKSPTQNLTLYPKLIPKIFEISYEYNGATAGNSVTFDHYTADGDRISIPNPTREGYEFDRWWFSSAFDDDEPITPGNTRGFFSSVTLYAKWISVDTGSITPSTPPAIVESVPYPGPLQDSSIESATAHMDIWGMGETITVKGDFPTLITNVSINDKTLLVTNWKYSPTEILITYPVTASSVLRVQIWNGRSPLLMEKTVVLVDAPKKEPVVKPIDVPKVEVKEPVLVDTGFKKVKRTIFCYKGKSLKKVTAYKPVCPKGYKAKPRQPSA